jgi:hypothetical protein
VSDLHGSEGVAAMVAGLAWALFVLFLLVLAFPWLDRLIRQAGRPDLALLVPFSLPPTLAALTASLVGVGACQPPARRRTD